MSDGLTQFRTHWQCVESDWPKIINQRRRISNDFSLISNMAAEYNMMSNRSHDQVSANHQLMQAVK